MKHIDESIICQLDVMMATRLEVTRGFIKTLAKCSPQRRKRVLENATNNELKALFELCLNMKLGNLPIDAEQFRRFKRHKTTFDTLANRRISIRKKRKIVNQKGGFVAAVAKFALPLLTHIIASQLSKAGRKR